MIESSYPDTKINNKKPNANNKRGLSTLSELNTLSEEIEPFVENELDELSTIPVEEWTLQHRRKIRRLNAMMSVHDSSFDEADKQVKLLKQKSTKLAMERAKIQKEYEKIQKQLNDAHQIQLDDTAQTLDELSNLQSQADADAASEAKRLEKIQTAIQAAIIDEPLGFNKFLEWLQRQPHIKVNLNNAAERSTAYNGWKKAQIEKKKRQETQRLHSAKIQHRGIKVRN